MRLKFSAGIASVLMLSLLCPTLPVARAAAQASGGCDPAALFARMRARTGGELWGRLGELRASGGATVSGLSGQARFDDDLRAGRYARRFDIAVMGRGADVFDGTTLWSQDISGGVHARDAAFPKALAVTESYLARRGYLDAAHPGEAATFSCQPKRRDHGRLLTVVRVHPRAGIPADLAIDPTRAVLASVTERLPISTQVTRYGDYRRAGGLVLPFVVESGTLSEPSDGYRFVVSRYRVAQQAGVAEFTAPAARNGPILRNGKRSATVPMIVEGHQLMVWASIDGRAPLPFILDTGGHAILTAGAAKALGLSGRGTGESGGSGAGTIALQYTRVKSIRIGDAEIDDQPMLIIPYPYSFYERGTKTPLAGIIGLEFFERFATRLDYAGRTVTFTPLRDFAYQGEGTPVPFTFQDDMPMIAASADAQAGTFGTDTGNGGSLILFGGFLKQHGFLARYARGDTLIGHGTGGSNSGSRQILRELTIGGHMLHVVPAYFTQMQAGAFSSWTEAGNIGYYVLSRFIPTYDYAHHVLYLESSPHAEPLPVERTGLRVSKNEPRAFDIDSVRPNSAAARAGIAAGDRILAVDGRPATTFSRADFVALAEQPAGTNMRVRVDRKGKRRDVSLRLRS